MTDFSLPVHMIHFMSIIILVTVWSLACSPGALIHCHNTYTYFQLCGFFLICSDARLPITCFFFLLFSLACIRVTDFLDCPSLRSQVTKYLCIPLLQLRMPLGLMWPMRTSPHTHPQSEMLLSISEAPCLSSEGNDPVPLSVTRDPTAGLGGGEASATPSWED